MQLLDQRAARNGDHKPEHDIDDGDLPPENAHQQHKAAEVDHRRRDQERERHPERQTRACKTDKQRYRRARAKRRHRSQECSYDPRAQAVEPAEQLLAPFGRKITLNIRDYQNQYAEQKHDFDCVIDKKQDAAADFAIGVESA